MGKNYSRLKRIKICNVLILFGSWFKVINYEKTFKYQGNLCMDWASDDNKSLLWFFLDVKIALWIYMKLSTFFRGAFHSN